MNKIAFFTRKDSGLFKDDLEKIFSDFEIHFTENIDDIKSLVLNGELVEIVIDFDLGVPEQAELIEWLDEENEVKYSFWADLKKNLQGEKGPAVISPINNDKVNEYVRSIKTIRNTVSNKFLISPMLSVAELDYMQVSDYDEEGVYLISQREIKAEDILPITLMIRLGEGAPSPVKCDGELHDAPRDGQDLDSKFYYKLQFNDTTLRALSAFYTQREQVNEFAVQWAQNSKDEE